MASWTGVCDHLRARSKMETPYGDCIRLLVQPSEQNALPREVEVRLLSRFEPPWIELVGSGGSTRHVPIPLALARNSQLQVGAYCIVGDELLVRQTLPLDGLRYTDLDEALTVLAQLGLEAERRSE